MGLSQIAANKSKKSEDILPQVESYFRQLSDRIRSRQLNLSAVDIQIDVAVDADVGLVNKAMNNWKKTVWIDILQPLQQVVVPEKL